MIIFKTKNKILPKNCFLKSNLKMSKSKNSTNRNKIQSILFNHNFYPMIDIFTISTKLFILHFQFLIVRKLETMYFHIQVFMESTKIIIKLTLQDDNESCGYSLFVIRFNVY